MMEHSTAVDYPSPANQFMAGIYRDLEEHVLTKTSKL